MSLSRNVKLRGVNLGGWLVLERWMTPSVFDGTDACDEYTFMQTNGAKKKIRTHHRDFITESDFQWLHDQGVNAIRIPVGYWVLDGDGPYVSCVGKLDWAFRMAERYDMHVLISLHGAPGSQNGWDHSGKQGKAQWHQDKTYQDKTLEVLIEIAKRYRNSPVFWGLELLNEPYFFLRYFTLRAFYVRAYKTLQATLAPHTRVVFHDSFMPRILSGVIGGGIRKVAMDIHWYHFNDILRALPLSIYRLRVRIRKGMLKNLATHQEVIIGEWSGVISHKKLDRYDNEKKDALTKKYLNQQKAIYDEVNGWFYWSYKTEKDEVWSFRSMVERGWLEL